MTNGFAIALGLCIIGFFALDHFVLHLDAARFTMLKLIAVIDWMAVWR